MVGSHTIFHEQVVKKKIIFLNFNIIFGLVKQFLRVLKHDQPSFAYIIDKFPELSEVKAK